MYMSSPVAGDGLIYGLSAKQKGQFVALDASTGALKWASEGREGEQASILLAPANVLFLTNTGRTGHRQADGRGLPGRKAVRHFGRRDLDDAGFSRWLRCSSATRRT